MKVLSCGVLACVPERHDYFSGTVILSSIPSLILFLFFFFVFLLNRSVIFLENKAMDDVLAKLAVAKIYLAKVYSNFVLERGTAEKSRTSRGK